MRIYNNMTDDVNQMRQTLVFFFKFDVVDVIQNITVARGVTAGPWIKTINFIIRSEIFITNRRNNISLNIETYTCIPIQCIFYTIIQVYNSKLFRNYTCCRCSWCVFDLNSIARFLLKLFKSKN